MYKEWLRLAGTSGSTWLNPCPSRDTQSRVLRSVSRLLLKISEEETPQSLWATCASTQPLTQHRTCSWCSEATSHFPGHASCPGTVKNVILSSASFSQMFTDADDTSSMLSFSRLNSQSSLCPSLQEKCSSPSIILFHWTLSSMPISVVLGAQRWTQHPRWSLTGAE